MISQEERERMYQTQLDIQLESLNTCLQTYVDNIDSKALVKPTVCYRPNDYIINVSIGSYDLVEIAWNTDPDGYSYGANDDYWYACALHELKIGRMMSQIATLAGASTSRELKDFKNDKEVYDYIVTLIESVNMINKALKGDIIWKE